MRFSACNTWVRRLLAQRNQGKHVTHTEKTIFPFPFTVNGIWSWWQFSFRFWNRWNSIRFRKPIGKLSPWTYPIQFERKWKYSVLSVTRNIFNYSHHNFSDLTHFHVVVCLTGIVQMLSFSLSAIPLEKCVNLLEWKWKYSFPTHRAREPLFSGAIMRLLLYLS